MKTAFKTALGGAIVAATMAVAPAAQAAHTIQYDVDANGAFAAEFGNDRPTTPTFDDIYTSFTVMMEGLLEGTISESSRGLTFSSAQVTDSMGNVVLDFFPLVLNGNPSFGSAQALIGPGTYTLRVTGNAMGTAPNSYAGTLNFAAVPEPATWAMLLLGFGILGFGMRRRNGLQAQPRMRVTYS